MGERHRTRPPSHPRPPPPRRAQPRGHHANRLEPGRTCRRNLRRLTLHRPLTRRRSSWHDQGHPLRPMGVHVPRNHRHPPQASPSGKTCKEQKPGRTQVTDLGIIARENLFATGGNLLPTPQATNATYSSNGYGPNLHETAGTLRDSFGPYAPAVAHWETITGRTAPAPTEPPLREGGKPRLSVRFVEWHGTTRRTRHRRRPIARENPTRPRQRSCPAASSRRDPASPPAGTPSRPRGRLARIRSRNMMNTLRSTRPRSRGYITCDMCGTRIPRNVQYSRTETADMGTIITVRVCDHCATCVNLCARDTDWQFGDDGFTADDLREWALNSNAIEATQYLARTEQTLP